MNTSLQIQYNSIQVNFWQTKFQANKNSSLRPLYELNDALKLFRQLIGKQREIVWKVSIRLYELFNGIISSKR